jgi:hypothetical protein
MDSDILARYRRGREDRVEPWLDAYVGRLGEQPAAASIW